jgi:hypothetical protein
MIASKTRFLSRSLRNQHRVLPTSAERWNNRHVQSFSSENEKHFHELGYLDERGLTVFDTLHEMQFRSCQVYAQNDLFGTYNPKSDKFEYMTFEEFSQKVHECRAVLKDLGAMVLLFHEIIRYLYILKKSNVPLTRCLSLQLFRNRRI